MKDSYLKDKDIQIEKLKLTYDSVIYANIGQFFAAIVLIYVLKDVIAHSTLIYWFIGLSISVVFGLFINYLYQNKSDESIISYAEWGNTYLFGVFIAGITWGSASILLFPPESIVHQSILELTIAGIVAASIGTISSDLRASFGFIILSLLPMAFVNLFSLQTNALSVTLLITIYLIVSLIGSFKSNQNLNENLKLKFISKNKSLKLKESEEKYRLLYEKSEDPMILISNNKISLANNAAINLLGYDSLLKLTNIPVLDLFPLKQLDGTLSSEKIKLIISELRKTGFYRCECSGRDNKGKTIPVDAMMTLIPLEGKQAIYCIFRDISENKRIQKELLVTQKQSENANLAKSKFLANMSHEIRTPMNGVIGITDLMLSNPLPEEQLIRAQAIKNSANSMLIILNDILDFSKIEAGKLGITLSDFNIIDLINDLNATAKSQMARKKIIFTTKIAKKLHHSFTGDSGRIKQILNNLTDNAYKFTHDGEVTLSCSSVEESESHALIKFSITDTGIGIGIKQQETLFDRFTQVDETTTRKYGGSGLGLSISKQLSKLMGGELGFSSTTDKGSNFWFTVKLLKIQEIEKCETQHNVLPNTNKHFKAKALVVDDNVTNLMVAEGMLERLGLSIHSVDEGEQAINALKKDNYDVVFMDCHMPVLDGYDATKNIRKENPKVLNPETIIIAMTASAMPGDKEKCIASGMNDYIAKPIDLMMLQRKLELWLPIEKQFTTKKYMIKKNAKPSNIAYPDSNEVLFDYQAIFNRLSGNQQLIKSISLKFISSIQEYINSIIVEIDNKNLTKIVSLAHKLKGSSASIGCMKLSELASIIEISGNENSMGTIVTTAKKLQSCYLKSVEAIYKMI